MFNDYKARLYLDFDDVINADKPLFTEVVRTSIKIKEAPGLFIEYPITFAPEVVKRLDSIMAAHNVELVWASSWNNNLEVLRLPKLLGGLEGGRVLNVSLDFSRFNTKRERTQWKADTILADQKNDSTPFAWVDDEAIEFHGKSVAAATVGTPQFFVEPRSYRGLTTSDLNRLDEFFGRLS